MSDFLCIGVGILLVYEHKIRNSTSRYGVDLMPQPDGNKNFNANDYLKSTTTFSRTVK